MSSGVVSQNRNMDDIAWSFSWDSMDSSSRASSHRTPRINGAPSVDIERHRANDAVFFRELVYAARKFVFRIPLNLKDRVSSKHHGAVTGLK